MFSIRKKLYLPAPSQGVAVYAKSQCYTSENGTELIEAIRYEARNELRQTAGGAAYYCKEIYQRISSDNGQNWEIIGDIYQEDPLDKEKEHPYPPTFFRDPDNGLLLAMYLTLKYDVDKGSESFSDEGITHKRRIYYQISRDQGRTWSKGKPLIHKGPEYDLIHWGPGLYYGKNGAGGGGIFSKLPDGTIIIGVTANLEDGKRYQAVFLRGKWKADLSDIEWEFSDYISMTPDKSSQGCCESVHTLMDDGRIFVSLRCCGDRENQTFPSLKFWVISEDNAKTFSDPLPLTYEDGSMVWSPSSYAEIIRSSVNKKFYWIGNILDKPTYSAYPRYPLCIAELIPEKGCLIKDTVTVIDTKPEDFEDEWRRYTNFGLYEDRETKEIVLTLPEQPKISRSDFTSDCYRYRITVK